MKTKFLCLILICTLTAISCGNGNSQKSCLLTGWGINENNPDEFISGAKEVGFDALISWSTDPDFLKKAVEAGEKNNIKIFSGITPMGGLGKLWTERFPERPVPWQIMTEDEEAARNFIMAGKNQYIIPFQFGGEPKLTNEVYGEKIICFNNYEARELFKPLIDKIVSVPGIEGLAFDGFGYQNYHNCNCDLCKSLLTEYRKKNPDLAEEEAEIVFFRNNLVDYINYLSVYARSKNADIKTNIHIWPVYAPDPLYGNRLDIDFCGQTAAWYNLWPEEKIARYTRIITVEAKKYHERQQGVPMIGYYDLPGEFPVKDAARVDMELRTMIENGSENIQVCGTSHVINNKEISAIFSKYFK